jgi:alpha-N-arabinofuranosidase
MTVSELMEERLSAYEGLVRAVCMERQISHPPAIAVDEWNVWYKTRAKESGGPTVNKLEEIYNLEDALVTAMHFNAFIRHAKTVKMANIAQIVNVIAPVFTKKDDMVLQTIFYPFELYSSTCGQTALDVRWQGDSFSSGKYSLPVLDVSATLDKTGKQLVLYVVNRSKDKAMETKIDLAAGHFTGKGMARTINGPDIKAENTFENKNQVKTREHSFDMDGRSQIYEFEPHSITALVCTIA